MLIVAERSRSCRGWRSSGWRTRQTDRASYPPAELTCIITFHVNVKITAPLFLFFSNNLKIVRIVLNPFHQTQVNIEGLQDICSCVYINLLNAWNSFFFLNTYILVEMETFWIKKKFHTYFILYTYFRGQVKQNVMHMHYILYTCTVHSQFIKRAHLKYRHVLHLHYEQNIHKVSWKRICPLLISSFSAYLSRWMVSCRNFLVQNVIEDEIQDETLF